MLLLLVRLVAIANESLRANLVEHTLLFYTYRDSILRLRTFPFSSWLVVKQSHKPIAHYPW